MVSGQGSAMSHCLVASYGGLVFMLQKKKQSELGRISMFSEVQRKTTNSSGELKY